MTVKIAKKYTTVDGIRAGIKSVLNRAVTWRNDVQAVAVACVNHAQVHGDWTLLRDLIEGITKTDGINKSKLKGWAEQFCHGSFEEDDKGELKLYFDDGHGVKDIDVEGAAGTNWFEWKPARKDTSKSLEEIRASVFKMLTASLKADKVTEEEGKSLLDHIDGLLEARAEIDEEIRTELAALRAA